jgi:hypothetical protein
MALLKLRSAANFEKILRRLEDAVEPYAVVSNKEINAG